MPWERETAAPEGGRLAFRATPTGLEPATSAVTGRRANQLRYGALVVWPVLRIPNGIRTRAAAVKGRSPRPLDDGDLPDLSVGTSKLYGSFWHRPNRLRTARPVGRRVSPSPRPGPRRRPRRDDALGRDAEALGALAAQRLHVELSRRVRVGVDGEEAAEVARELDELVGRVAALGARVDLDRDVVLEARPEDLLGVELGRRPLAAAPVTSWPVQWASTLVRGLRTAATMRGVIRTTV